MSGPVKAALPPGMWRCASHAATGRDADGSLEAHESAEHDGSTICVETGGPPAAPGLLEHFGRPALLRGARPITQSLPEYLHARYDEHAYVANLYRGGLWAWLSRPPQDADVYSDGSLTVVWPHWPDWNGPLPHISRWSPETVLADIAAKRRILERHGQPHDCRQSTGTGQPFPRAGQPMFRWPCPDLADLAAPYAGRDDFNQAWLA